MTMSPALTPETAAAEAQATPVRVAVIVGSIRTGRFGPAPARWIADRARRREGFEVDLIDLAEADVPPVLGGDSADARMPEQIAALSRRLHAADAFIVVTPVYNRSFPGSVKNAIDWFFSEWRLKPVGFVSYGGTYGGIESVAALREVFAEFDAVALSYAVAFPDFWEAFDHDSLPVDAERAAARAARLFDQLEWWAATLREGRARQPFPGTPSD
ncbi:NADPH-dependent FMN reductase [Brevibacterium album]|uniref:NADPH-dependent FMN reductase n=1 Tax=Brevibacterium album TaxID=417948 RepID=UPI0003FF9E2D|nr:NAD(P)H-dependent oxidoreductase [Brevibacterium album]